MSPKDSLAPDDDAAGALKEIITGAINSQLTPGLKLVIEERMAHMIRKGYTAAHDDEHDGHELVSAALAYVGAYHKKFGRVIQSLSWWPWEPREFKPDLDKSGIPKDPYGIRVLTKAASFLIAEIDRRLRQKALKDITKAS